MKKIGMILLILCLCVGFVGCGSNEPESVEGHVQIRFDLTDGRYFVITVMPEYAPKTVAAIVKLVKQGYYDGNKVHRVSPGYWVQMGMPLEGGAPPTVAGEFAANGWKNGLKHARGVVSLARATAYDSGSSQFFICLSDNVSFLDGNYAAFGIVTEGMDVIDSFCELELTYNSALRETSSPVTPPVIARAYVVE